MAARTREGTVEMTTGEALAILAAMGALPMAGGSGEDEGEAPPALDAAVARELEELRAWRQQHEPQLGELRGQVESLTKERGELVSARDAAQRTALDAHRRALLAEHRDVVPELVQGESVEALSESIEGARAAYSRIAEQARASAEPPPARVAAGAPARSSQGPPEIANLHGSAAIAHALRQSR